MSQPVPAFRLDRLFDERATRTPDAVALVDENGSMTFAELDSASAQLACAIRAAGARGGAFVGVHLERSSRYVVTVLAILRANGAVVPLPPSYPEGRLREILSFAALDTVIDDHDTPLDPRLHERIVHASDACGVANKMTKIAPGSPDQPAFVLCSSGSTGNPKMIVRSHRSFFHRLQWTWDKHPYEPGEVCCQKAHMTTTHAVYELFEPLLRGIPVCIIPDRVTKTLESFWDTITRRAISRLLIVPSMLQASMDVRSFRPLNIKVLVLMGEYVHPKLAARTIAAFPEATKIYSIYGSTEASSTIVCNLRESVHRDDELPLGKPICADVRAYVLDDSLEPVAAGTVGMLYIAGPALFSEYFKDPALTAAAFVTPGHGGERLYRTNDQVRRAADGALQFLGRVDHTVKIRGFRVDLQEVEGAMARHPDVSQCAVIAVDSGDGSAMLVAFVRPATVRIPSVYRALREQLPDYMVPSDLVALDAFPLTSSGKVDRNKLVEGYDTRVAASPFGRRQSETERRISEAWATVLKHGATQPDANFFEVGGTSLKVFSVVAQLREAFSLDRHQLSDGAVYRYPTIAALAAHVDSLRHGEAGRVDAGASILVTLKSGGDVRVPPLFVISSAGGTLGAYEKVVRALRTTREVIGVRDPFLWDGRDPALGFQSWVSLYVAAIRERQAKGPYYLAAYSSAGAFGYEIARQLCHAGEKVALLALIDPLAMDRSSRRRFGYWALRARSMRQSFRRIVLFGGWLRRAVPRWLRESGRSTCENDFAFTREQLLQVETQARTSQQHILGLSVLLELNTGLPFALTREELAQLEPGRYVAALLAKVRSVDPDIETQAIEKIVFQHQLQVRSQHQYRLQRYHGAVMLFEPDGTHQGLLASQLRPYVDRLRVFRLALGSSSERVRELTGCFSRPMRCHYVSMRDDAFVDGLARELDKLLR